MTFPRPLRLLAAALAVMALGVAAQSASAVGVTAAFRYGFDAYSKYSACMKNLDAGQPCLATDSDNIRQVLKDVKALRAEIQANQAAVNAQLGLLQATLDLKVRNDLLTILNPVTLNMPSALAALQGLEACADARVHRKTTCTGQDGTQVPVAKGMADHQAVLVFKAGLMGDDILSTTAVLTGDPVAGDRSGVLAADWLLNKNVQQNDAGSTNASIIGAFKAPVVTPQVANAVTKFAVTYNDFLRSYGMVKPFVTAMQGRPAVALSMQQDVLSAIYGDAPFSVRSRVAQFTFPRLEPNEIAYVDRGDGRAWIVSPRPGRTYLLAPSAVFGLGRAISEYGVASIFREKRPSAFPADGWYPVRVATHHVKVCPRTGTFCNLANGGFYVDQLARSSSNHIVTRMRLENQRPAWNDAWEATAYGTMGVDFKQDFAHFVSGPANYDWYAYRYQPSNIGIDYTVGPGAWVKRLGVFASQTGSVTRLAAVPPMMGWPS